MKLYFDVFCSSHIQICNFYIDDEMYDDDEEFRMVVIRIIKCSLHLNIHLAFGFHIVVS